jgi:hypothetical protein
MAANAQGAPIYESILTVVIQQKGVQRQDINMGLTFNSPSTVFIDIHKLREILEPAIQDLITTFAEEGKFPELGIIDDTK